jgi:hypothetical protein
MSSLALVAPSDRTGFSGTVSSSSMSHRSAGSMPSPRDSQMLCSTQQAPSTTGRSCSFTSVRFCRQQARPPALEAFEGVHGDAPDLRHLLVEGVLRPRQVGLRVGGQLQSAALGLRQRRPASARRRMRRRWRRSRDGELTATALGDGTRCQID